MRRFLLLFAGLIMTVSLFAQEVVEYGPDVFIDIDGIEIGGKPSREELIKHFGELVSNSYVEGDLYNYYSLKFRDVEIGLWEDGGVLGFKSLSSTYYVMTLYGLGEGVKVGDSLEKFLSLGYPIYSGHKTAGVDGEYYYMFYIRVKDYIPDYHTYFTIRDGIIVCIDCWPDFS